TCTSPRSPQPSRPLPTPSSWSIKPAGTCPPASSCRPISPSFCCRRSAQSSTRSRTSGSSCATTGSPTASSNPTTISSTIVVRHGTSSSISLGASCPSDCANGPTGSDQWDLVLVGVSSVYLRKAAVNELVSLNPTSNPISVTDSLRSASKVLARSIRRLVRYWCGGMPNDCLNAREKW